MSARARPRNVVVEEVLRDPTGGTPYRGMTTPPAVLRMHVKIERPTPHEVEVEIVIDDAAMMVRTPHPTDAANPIRIALGALEAMFVVERQPRAGFFTWFGVYARQRGRVDQLVLETPEVEVARYVEHVIERWLLLTKKPVRGEVRLP
jgi:hypothetical protein